MQFDIWSLRRFSQQMEHGSLVSLPVTECDLCCFWSFSVKYVYSDVITLCISYFSITYWPIYA